MGASLARRRSRSCRASASPLAAAGASLLTVAVDRAEDEAKVRAAAQGLGLPVMIAGDDVAGTYSILHRYLFDRREDLRLPTLSC